MRDTRTFDEVREDVNTVRDDIAATKAQTIIPPIFQRICAGIDTWYNERSYNGRKGEEGLEDDDGHGWCARRRLLASRYSLSRFTPRCVVCPTAGAASRTG